MKRERKIIRVEEIFQYADKVYDNWLDCYSRGMKDQAERYSDMFNTAIDIMYWLDIKEQYNSTERV